MSTSKQNEKLSLRVLKTITYKGQPKQQNINLHALNKEFDHVCLFDSNQTENQNQQIDLSKIIAIGSTQELKITHSKNGLEELQKFYDDRKGWLFGYLSYDVKNEIETLSSENNDNLNFPSILFFAPKIVIQANEALTTVTYDDEFINSTEAVRIYNLSISQPSTETNINRSEFNILSKISKQEYLQSVKSLQQHIKKGDVYEVNFCQEFYAKNSIINPPEIFEKLNSISKAPFTAFCKFDEHYAFCASPERYLQKLGTKLLSQPIKGTIKRSLNKVEDQKLKNDLQNNPKEQSENVMIVDLIRNDFSRIAVKNSVNVDELFGVYSYKQLHQMISTISCELSEDLKFTDIIKGTFPMGSMTGAPKVSAMKLIEKHESTKRGIYSGTIGYITPEGNFDFNVVIRSILYNSKSNYSSFMVGSAITDKAIPEDEYKECLLKAKALFEVLKN